MGPARLSHWAVKIAEKSSARSLTTGLTRKYVADTDSKAPLPRDHFPLIRDTKWCLRCNFYELCEQELASSARKGPYAAVTKHRD